MANKASQVTQEELENLRNLNRELSNIKIDLGSIELEKMNIMDRAYQLRGYIESSEKGLVEKYGGGAIVNLQTGMLTYKTK